jgi:AcrR family transcriptional regulator
MGSDPQGPLDEWLDGLSPTAVHIAAAGRRLLLEGGYEAVTIEAVALEANVDSSTVRRLFVTKAGLVHAIWDRLQIEPWAELVATVRELPPESRFDAYVRGLGGLLEDRRLGIATAEVVAHGLRDEIVRSKIAADYDIARDSTFEVTGMDQGEGEDARRMRTLVSLVIAVIDGLAMQAAADPDAVDVDDAFAMLADMIALRRERDGRD